MGFDVPYLPPIHPIGLRFRKGKNNRVEADPRPDGREYFRPNLWPNTPDILSEYLQVGGRPAFVARVVLAATLGASTRSTRSPG
ncbi:MAG: hypothetical protein ACHBMF_11495 [Chromatiales bacterium]